MKTIFKSIFLLSILFLTITIFGQTTTFDYLFATGKDEFPYDIVEDTTNGSYIICGAQKNPGSYNDNGFILRISDEGAFIDSATIIDNRQRLVFSKVLPGYSDSLVFAGFRTDTIFGKFLNTSLVFYVTDMDLNPKDTVIHHLISNYSYLNGYVKTISENRMAVIGSMLDTAYYFSPRMFIHEFSHSLDSLTTVYWLDSIANGQDLKVLPNGNYWCLLHGFNGYTPKYYFFDSAFNVLSEKMVPHDLSDPFGVKWDSDSTFYITGEWNGGPDDDVAFMHQLYYDPDNPDKNLFNWWGTLDTMDLPAYYGGLDFNNKDSIFMGGTTNWVALFANVPSWFYIYQTDSMLNIRWERFYGGDAYYAMDRLIATSDGGCIAVGYKYDYLHTNAYQRDIYVIKLNSEGLLVGNEEHPSIKMQEALVFPNPGTNEIRVRVAAQYSESLFRLFDMNGKEVLEQKISGRFATVNSTFLKPGTYIYRITSSDGLHESGKWVKQ